jgi:hypothetical protein
MKTLLVLALTLCCSQLACGQLLQSRRSRWWCSVLAGHARSAGPAQATSFLSRAHRGFCSMPDPERSCALEATQLGYLTGTLDSQSLASVNQMEGAGLIGHSIWTANHLVSLT